jgi:hypothetical protein
MILNNRGKKAELVSRIDLSRHFNNVKKSGHQCFYDYIGTIKGKRIHIEVKYVYFKYHSANLSMKFAQSMNLIKGGDFVLYIRSNRGQCFVDPIQFMSFAHVHFNRLNPKTKNIMIRIYDSGNGELSIKELQSCQLCEGTLRNWLTNNQSARKSPRVVSNEL